MRSRCSDEAPRTHLRAQFQRAPSYASSVKENTYSGTTNILAAGPPLVSVPLHVMSSDRDTTLDADVSHSIIGTPSTISTAPSTDDASAEGVIDQAGKERSLIMEDLLLDFPSPLMLPSRDHSSAWTVGSNNQFVQPPLATRAGTNIAPVVAWRTHLKSSEEGSSGQIIPFGMMERDRRSSIDSCWFLEGSNAPRAPPPVDTDEHFMNVSSPCRPPKKSRALWGDGVGISAQRTGTRVASVIPEESILENRSHRSLDQIQHASDPWRQETQLAYANQFDGVQQPGFMNRRDAPVGDSRDPTSYHDYGMQTNGGIFGQSPPRTALGATRGRFPRQPGRSQHRQIPPPLHTKSPPGGHPIAAPPRSSSEILKTLLRKKACLYEPQTSPAVALITWLVGRELALAFGYFSRQQLQLGVHGCVSQKINSGAITRTKVNRCMQIILNSCFHYVIPRPDGKEERGEGFKSMFAPTAKDDSFLVKMLSPPWDGLVIDHESIVEAATATGDNTIEAGKTESPLLCGKAPPDMDQSNWQYVGSSTKRAVLLCFNENVRSADDVFRCHNEFIRDTANATKLQISAKDWKLFFGKGILTPENLKNGTVGNEVTTKPRDDLLGQMKLDDLSKFRTSWCAKRYDHDPRLCVFAHVDEDGGWIRRNPTIHKYKAELCPSVSTIANNRFGPRCFVINQCPHGVDCVFAHSKTEIEYHPSHYKTELCSEARGNCSLGDVCSKLHVSDSSSQTKNSANERYPEHKRIDYSPGPHRQPKGSSKGDRTFLPRGAPVLYMRPAPISNFEKHMMMPGLQNLFRRNCSVTIAHLHGPDKCKYRYSHFGDDREIGGRGEEMWPVQNEAKDCFHKRA